MMFKPNQIQVFVSKELLQGFERMGVDIELRAYNALVDECIHRKIENPDWEGYNWYFDKLTTSNGNMIFRLQNFKPE
jgi:hypothetical protein